MGLVDSHGVAEDDGELMPDEGEWQFFAGCFEADSRQEVNLAFVRACQ